MINIYTPLERGLGSWIAGAEHSSFEEAEVVLIPGGSDWQPSLYGHSKLSSTYIYPESDIREMDLINEAVDAGKFIIGICKGSQGLTIRAGGWLIQHVTNHGGYHKMETHDGKILTVNSTHHQMSYPYDLPEQDYKLLGWAAERSNEYRVATEKVEHEDPELAFDELGRFKEPEVIWYPKIRGMAVQFHPEYTSAPEEANVWLNQQLIKLLEK